MKRQRKYRAWNGEKMIFRGLHDKNWYTEPFGGKVVQPAYQDDIHYLKVMDFTGLKDKNEVEIYEGDILSFTYQKNERKGVVTIEKYYHFILKTNEKFFNLYHIENAETGIIIGNIYENPELLKK
jgi:uncharacterized phage protein (TIGR01671 family)